MRRLLALSIMVWGSVAMAQQPAPRLGNFFSLGAVTKSAYGADGSLIVGGGFDRVGAIDRRNLVRFAPAGTLDTSWLPNPDGVIRGIAFDAGGNLYVAGNFRNISLQLRFGLAKFLPGSPFTIDPLYLPQIPSDASTVDSLVLRSDGTAYVSYCVSVPQNCRILRLNAQGAVMGSFNAMTLGPVFPMALSADEQFLLVSGQVVAINGVPIPSRANLAKLNANTGAMDASWIPFATGNGSVRVILADGPSHILVAGSIPGGVDGLARIPLANPGTADVEFGPDVGPSANVNMQELLRAPDGDLIISGAFTEVDSQPRSSRLARLAPDGSARAGWGATAPTGGANSNSMAIAADGTVLSPRFTRPGLTRTTLFELSNSDGSNLASLTNATLSSHAGFQRLVREPISGRIFAGAAALEEISGRQSPAVFAFQSNLQPDLGWTSALGSKVVLGGTLQLSTSATSMVLGAFGFGADGLPVSGLYRLNAVDGSNHAWEPQGSAGVGLSTDAPQAVLVDEAGGFAYALGINRDAAGSLLPGRPFLRFALADGLRDPTWLPTISTSGTPALLLDDGFVYVSGVASATATDNSTVLALARFAVSGTGRADPGFKPFTTATTLQAMTQDANFIYVGGPSRLARVDKTSGVVDGNWMQGLINPGAVTSLSLAADGGLFLTGALTLGCQGETVKVARVLPGGNFDPTWVVDLNQSATSTLAIPPADVLVGGFFNTVNGSFHDGLVRLGRSDGLFYDGLGDQRCLPFVPL